MNSAHKYIPNSLSIFRILLSMPFVYFLYRDKIPAVIIISLLMILSDYFDGFLARKLGATSTAGKILDPLADKLCFALAGIALVVWRDFPLLLIMALLARDMLILLSSLFIIRSMGIIPSSNIPGKVTAGMVALCMLIYLFRLDPLKTPAVVLTAIMIPASVISYAKKLYGIVKHREFENPC